MRLTDQQVAVLEMVKKNRISILTGGPGTGKTTITQQIIEWAKKEDYIVSLCSPTGKAAKVLSKACYNHPAFTIHKILHPQATRKHGKLQFDFGHNIDNPLPCTFLIADEMSMVGNGLMASLLSAIDHTKTKLLLIGDSNQLPSIQPGNILHDLIACGYITTIELTKVFRHSGEIIQFCTAIRTNSKDYTIPLSSKNKINLEAGNNYLHIETSSMETIHETIIKLATINMPRRNFEINRDEVQILSPTNSRTILSCDALNIALQDIINPQPENNRINNGDENKVSFRLGSRIINCKNLYDAKNLAGNEEIVLNGDTGKIIDLQDNNRFMVVRFKDPERDILVNKYNHNLKLSYCITSHRSQGSGFDCVIMPVHSVFQYQMNRAMLYTSVSRAKKILITVGEKSAIRQAIRDIRIYHRKTFLQEKINDRLLEQL